MASAVSERVVVDTGPLVAIFSARDAHHASCVGQLKACRPPLETTWPVLTEAVYLLRRSPVAVRRLLASLENSSWLRVVDLREDAGAWFTAFFARFCDREAQLADASLVYLAERGPVARVFTLDRRDFGVYRTSDGAPLRVLP